MAKEVLVFTTCYNERENIGPMIDRIASNVPDADILVVDDNSPDGTWDIIESKQAVYPQLKAVKRPGKLGIGSAHKYALFYAMREGYKTVVTMDADFSHNPDLIPSLLAAHGPDVFVTGSRYCKGGSSDYSGYRDIVSRFGNKLARMVLGVRIYELTTYFRVFDVQSLRRLPLRLVAASGYSYGVELVYHLRKAGVELREVPIHFVDRTHGASKIPRLQIFKSAFDLFLLGLRRFNILRDLQPDEFVGDSCGSCGDQVLAMKHFGSRTADRQGAHAGSAEYRCTAVGAENYPPVYTCLACGLEQVPKSLMPSELRSLYEDVVDTTYIENAHVREKTYRRSFDQVKPFLPAVQGGGKLLEVGAYCGLFLKEATRQGWSGVGVEPSKWASRYAREETGVDVRQGFLDEVAPSLESRYDLVVSWDVLEHVGEPLQFLKNCGQFLEEGGVLAISTLDVDTWFPQLLGTRWPWLMDMHLFYFSEKSLKTLLSNAGFDLIKTESYVHYASVRHAINGGTRILPGPLRPIGKAVASLVPQRLTVPVAFGDIKLYVAVKRGSEPSSSGREAQSLRALA